MSVAQNAGKQLAFIEDRIFWWARQDLNLGPTDYESAALTAELRARFALTILQRKKSESMRDFLYREDGGFKPVMRSVGRNTLQIADDIPCAIARRSPRLAFRVAASSVEGAFFATRLAHCHFASKRLSPTRVSRYHQGVAATADSNKRRRAITLVPLFRPRLSAVHLGGSFKCLRSLQAGSLPR
jgi:hypothetical protein